MRLYLRRGNMTREIGCFRLNVNDVSACSTS